LFREQFRNLISAGLGGRAAECIVYEDFTSGAVSDIQRITAISQTMVTEFGMSDEIGPIRYSRGNMSIPGLPGGMGMGEGSVCSEATQQKIDREVKKIIDNEFEKAKRILTENRAALDELVELLMVRETVNGEEAVAILKKHSP
jgi:cell division protease FtsH